MRLTKREQEITDLLLEGLSLKQIANKLFIEYCTVQSHLKNIFKRYNVHSIGQYCGLYVKDLKDQIDFLKGK